MSSHKSRTLNLDTKFWLKKCVNYASKYGKLCLTDILISHSNYVTDKLSQAVKFLIRVQEVSDSKFSWHNDYYNRDFPLYSYFLVPQGK